MTDIDPTAKLVTLLEEAARYFEKRDTRGEDMAFWSNVMNVMNAENCRKAALALADKTRPPAPSQTAVEPVMELVARAKKAVALGTSMGARGQHASNIYNIAADLIATLTAQAAALVAAEQEVANLRASFATSETERYEAIARAEAAEKRIAELEAGLEPPYEFDRYVNGVLMAEGVTIEAVTDLAKATLRAVRIASRGPNGEAPVLVLRARRLTHQEKNNGR